LVPGIRTEECIGALNGSVIEWKGRRRKMRSETAQRKEFIDAAMPDIDAEVEREAQKQIRIRKRVQELTLPGPRAIIDENDFFESAPRIDSNKPERTPSIEPTELSVVEKYEESADPVTAERLKLLAEFKQRGRRQGINKITDEMITQAANPDKWNGRTQIGWWKRNNAGCNSPCDRKIRQLLARQPSEIWPEKTRK